MLPEWTLNALLIMAFIMPVMIISAYLAYRADKNRRAKIASVLDKMFAGEPVSFALVHHVFIDKGFHYEAECWCVRRGIPKSERKEKSPPL